MEKNIYKKFEISKEDFEKAKKKSLILYILKWILTVLLLVLFFLAFLLIDYKKQEYIFYILIVFAGIDLAIIIFLVISFNIVYSRFLIYKIYIQNEQKWRIIAYFTLYWAIWRLRIWDTHFELFNMDKKTDSNQWMK